MFFTNSILCSSFMIDMMSLYPYFQWRDLHVEEMSSDAGCCTKRLPSERIGSLRDPIYVKNSSPDNDSSLRITTASIINMWRRLVSEVARRYVVLGTDNCIFECMKRSVEFQPNSCIIGINHPPLNFTRQKISPLRTLYRHLGRTF